MVEEGFRLDLLLKIAKLARFTYYYQVKQLNKPDKNEVIKSEIQAIDMNIGVIMATVEFIWSQRIVALWSTIRKSNA